MSKENVDLVRRCVEVINRGGLPAALEIVDEVCDPDAELRSVGGLPDVDGLLRGHEAIKTYFAQLFAAFDYHFEVDEYIDAGGAVVAVSRQIARGRGSGAEVSEENVDRFLETIEAFNQGDVERWLETFHPDVVAELQNVQLEGGCSGHDGLRRFLADFAESFEMFDVHCTDVRDLGDQVLALGTLHTIGRGSETENEGPVAIVATYRDELCTHFKDYGERGQALEAAGLSE